MGDSSAKKRKREHLQVEDQDPQRRHKTRVVEHVNRDARDYSHPAPQRPTRDGKSRQEKSERRSLKKHKKHTADPSPAHGAGGDDLDLQSPRAHKRHQNGNTEEEPAAGQAIGKAGDERSGLSLKQSAKGIPTGQPSDEAHNGTAAAAAATASANGPSLRVAQSRGETRRKEKVRAKAASTPRVENEVTPQDSTATCPSDSKPQRFIVFVGNLPYSATTAQIESHFAKLAPTSVRHRTDKATGRSKGFAFLEFAGYDKMKTCLKLYHHSVFDPQGSKDKPGEEDNDRKKRGRRINVELTVGGGGGRSKKRKEKIKGKNLKLGAEREQRRLKGLQDAEEAEKKRKNPATNANVTLQTEKESNMRDVHPSRRSRVA
jgi:nucleolar protein 6